VRSLWIRGLGAPMANPDVHVESLGAPMANPNEHAEGMMGEHAEKEYADFEARVKRTIYIDHLSPVVTRQVIRAALSQCAHVVSVEFVENYTIPYDIPAAALVELDDESQARSAVDLMRDFPFIIGGMPRPVRASLARPEMFPDRPSPPGSKMEFLWLKQGDPEYDGMSKLKSLAKRQEAENMALIKVKY
uniref:RRM domain-containing protein n=2 Tax=Aegilops tauschii subsp. strangulata TaxID=200361 RepID=A0A453H3X4_AEGTS